MAAVSLTILFALIAPLTAYRGVAYDSYNWGSVHGHFSVIRQRFDTVRTFQTYLYNYNAIDVAAQNNLNIYAGVWIRGGLDFNTDLQAAVAGAKRNPNNVRGVFIGNEDLHNGWSVSQVISAINQARGAFAAAGLGNIRIGTVQTDGSWLSNPGLADVCDIVGVNIYPFFGASSQSVSDPISDLSARWNAIYSKFGGKAMLTETGWPFGGGNYGNHVSNFGNAQSYFNQFVTWANSNGGEAPIYFMFHDNPNKGGFEAQFGLANKDAQWKYDFPSLVGGSSSSSSKSNGLQMTTANLVLTAANGGVSFKSPPSDKSGTWTFSGNSLKNQATGECLDAWQGWNGGSVHTWSCDSNNGNQQWSYDSSTKQLRHKTFNGFCLDIGSNNGASPYLWQCHGTSDYWVKFQQFNLV